MQDTMHVSQQEIDLVSVIQGEQTREELQSALNINNRDYFRVSFIKAVLDNGLINMTIPEKPTSKNQKYYITTKGKR
jgi:ATP-dependent DNA helicase RecG